MPMQSLQAASSLVNATMAMMIDAPAGKSVASARNAVARRSSCRRVRHSSTVNSSRNANTDMAGSEMGMPPHTASRITDE